MLDRVFSAADTSNSLIQLILNRLMPSRRVLLSQSNLIDFERKLAPILFRIVEMYCPKNIWIYWGILIFILDKQYRTELG